MHAIETSRIGGERGQDDPHANRSLVGERAVLRGKVRGLFLFSTRGAVLSTELSSAEHSLSPVVLCSVDWAGGGGGGGGGCEAARTRTHTPTHPTTRLGALYPP